MTYQLSWLATLIMVVVAVIIGVASAAVIRDGALRTIWALLVALVFIAAGLASIVTGFSWMFTDMVRGLAQAVAIGAALVGIIYATRAPN